MPYCSLALDFLTSLLFEVFFGDRPLHDPIVSSGLMDMKTGNNIRLMKRKKLQMMVALKKTIEEDYNNIDIIDWHKILSTKGKQSISR